MQLFKSLLAGAALVASAAAAGGRLRFTSFTPSVEVGDPVTVTWAGGSNAPVTITLRKGPSTNLEDVAVLTTTGTGGSYTWIPDTTLPDGTNYALQINQGEDINYTGQFSIEGGSPEAPTATTATTEITVPTTATDSSSYSITPSSGSPTSPSSTPSSTLVTSSSTNEGPTPSGEASTVTVNPTVTPTVSSTTTAPTTTQTGGAASMASPLTLVLGLVAAAVYLN